MWSRSSETPREALSTSSTSAPEALRDVISPWASLAL
jgi:hypothetical protein